MVMTINDNLDNVLFPRHCELYEKAQVIFKKVVGRVSVLQRAGAWTVCRRLSILRLCDENLKKIYYPGPLSAKHLPNA